MIFNQPDTTHQVLDRHFSSCLQLYRSKFWTGFRWMAININSPAEKPYFFEDYILADNFCSEMLGYKIMSLSRAIKLLLNKPRFSITPVILREFDEIIQPFPVTLQIAQNALIDLLELNEYIPVEWLHKYHPLSSCNAYHLLVSETGSKNNQKHGRPKMIFASSIFTNAVQHLYKTIQQLRCETADRRIFLIGQLPNQKLDTRSLETVFATAITFYYCDLALSKDILSAEIVQVHDPTDLAFMSYNYFIKYHKEKKEINFFSSLLKKSKPGLFAHNYSSIHFLNNPTNRYKLVPHKFFGW